MKYIDATLLPDERVIFRTRKHLIIFFLPTMCTFLLMLAYFYMLQNLVLHKLVWAPCVVGLLIWWYVCLEYFMADYVVTNKRLRMREGFFLRHVNDVRLSAIFQVSVNQSLLGQLLSYGSVSINALGISDTFTLVERPYLLQHCLNEALERRDASPQ